MDTLTNLHSAIRRSDLVDILGERAVRAAVAAGEWTVPWPGVLVPVGRAQEPMTLVAAATLFAGPTAIVVARTAAWLHGCRSAEPLPVHVAVPYGHKPRSHQGLVVHNGRGFGADTVERAGLPVLALDRVLGDLLCRDHGPTGFAVFDEALSIAEDVEALRAEVRHRVATRSDRRGTRRAAILVELAGGRPRSPAESRLQFRIVDLGFPNPVLNHPIHDGNGRVVFLVDLAWPGLRIALEYDGHETHSGRELADAERQRELERRGYLVIRVRADDLTDITRVQQDLAAAFRARGFPLRRDAGAGGALQARRHRERVWTPR